MMKRRIAALLSALLLAASPAALAAGGDGDEAAVAALPGKQWALHSLKKTRVTKVAQITGEESENKTQSRFGVWGTDLGSMAVLNGKTYMFGGDTFGAEDQSHWRSNVLFVIEDDDPSDGLTITDAVTDKTGRAKELLRSLKREGTEVTVIPTNLFSANGKLYCIYMSVSHWGDAGRWDCRHSGLAVSEDEGQTWKKLSDVMWPGDSNFIQTANCEIGDTMYFFGIPAGRMGGVALMKAPTAQIEDFSLYAYFTGTDEAGAPVFVQGEEGLAQAKQIIEGPVGEISVLYDAYLGNFILTYMCEKTYSIVMREGVTPWGPWGEPVTLATGAAYPSLYGAFMHPKYVEQEGRTFYFAMSQFFPIYNIQWMKAELPAIERGGD